MHKQKKRKEKVIIKPLIETRKIVLTFAALFPIESDVSGLY